MFLCRSYVELDNFLPLFVKMRSEFSGVCKIQSLVSTSCDLMTPMVSRFVSTNELHDPSDIFVPNIWTMLARFFSNDFFRKPRHNKYIFIKIIGKLFSVCERICRKKIKIKSAKPSILILSEGNHKGLQGDNWDIGSLSQYFNDLIDDSSVSKLIFPETFDQFNERPEFDTANERTVETSNFFLSRGQRGKVNSIVPSEKILNVGVPRYSSFWCEQLDEYFASRKSEPHNPREIKLLYVPIKTSPGPPISTAETIANQDRLVFELLEKNQNMQIWVKPHPKTHGAGYEETKLLKYTKYVDRVKVIDNLTDTSELASHADIIISPGSSFIPHCLWLGKPVILLDEWAKRVGYSFTFQSLCFPVDAVEDVLKDISSGMFSLTKAKEKEMQSFFQLGMDCPKYEKFLSSIMKKLGKTALENY